MFPPKGADVCILLFAGLDCGNLGYPELHYFCCTFIILKYFPDRLNIGR